MRPLLFVLTVLVSLLSFSGCKPLAEGLAALAERQKQAPGLDWKSNRDLTSERYGELFKIYSDQGYRIIDVDAYSVGFGRIRYAMVWVKNTDGRGWAQYRDMTSDQYHAEWNKQKDKGYRPIDVEVYKKGGKWRYAGIWIENKEGLDWKSNRNMTSTEYGNTFQERRAAGYRLIDVEVVDTDNGGRYSGIWVENRENWPWAQLRNMSRTEYQTAIDEKAAAGFRVIDFESYQLNGQQKYAAIWLKDDKKQASAVRSGRTEVQFANYWRQYRDEGYRLIDFERYPTSNGTRYAGVWVENEQRLRWEHASDVNTIVENYRSQNQLKGISLVIMEGSKLQYQRGFGWADEDEKQTAHGESVYNIASVSKVVGSTLAAKLADEGRLKDGTRVNLDLTKQTRDYIELPGTGHTHTIEQLTAHLGCVRHYNMGFNSPTGYHATALEASEKINNQGIRAGCTVGTNYGYSTHAYTHLGAVLEEVTDRPVAQLVEEEIADRYRLPSLRAMYRFRSLRPDYERVRPYSPGGNEINYSDNSWKVLGGGLESNMVDLAKFARLVQTGTIVSQDTRDYLWTRLDATSSSTYGIGWDTNAANNFVEHGGDGTGTRTYLRVYTDNQTQWIIAVAATAKTAGLNLPALTDQIVTELNN
ncbi:serine hydrolase [Lewinella sp. 4G2]|uniref:serine hydrolase n=1 Tax=Lewinella sp. 4G2 TaxID=1803372 RepID=UPI0007E16AF6|nr:serine hydrolase [Lewinella sp. 4G2]OAV43112.1 hypothetical protein A3850_000755 [Lewinella sp. 4G2]